MGQLSVKDEAKIIENALEGEQDSLELCIDAWKRDTNGILKEVYGEKEYFEHIKWLKRDLKDVKALRYKYWKIGYR